MNPYDQQFYPDTYSPPPQVPVSQDELYANMAQEERIKNIIAQISPEHVLNDIKMTIKGYTKNPLNGLWEKIDPNIPEPSPVLVGRFIGFLSSVMNQSTSLSNLSENQINKLMKLVIEWLSDDLDANAYEYGLQSNYTERTRIGLIICNTVFMVFNRALNGQEARRMWGTLNLSEQFGMGEPKKGGIPDFLKFWK